MEKPVIDLATLDSTSKSAAGVEMEILGLNDEPTGAFLTIYGVDSPLYRKTVMELQEKQGEGEQGPEEQLEALIEMAAALTGGWRNVVLDGENLPFCHENVVKLYRRCPLIQQQILPFANRRANFFLK